MTISPTAFQQMSGALVHFHLPTRLNRIDEVWSTRQDEDESISRILFVGDGEGTLMVDHQTFMVGRGSVFLAEAALPLKLESKKQSPLRGICIEYRSFSIDGTSAYGLQYPIPLQGLTTDILRIAGELERLWREPQIGGPFRLQQLFIELLKEIYREMESRQERWDSWMERALQYIEANFEKDLTREQVAGLANVSPAHFSRAFRKHTGRTFNAYLNMLRIRSAQTRIVTGSGDLNTLAQEVGYREGLYLSRKFKEWVGVSPTMYQRMPKRIAALNPNHTAMLMALDVPPELGVYTPWLEHAWDKREKQVGAGFNPYALTPHAYHEAVAATLPDIILSYDQAEENKRLLPIAPVLQIPFKTMSWREQFRLVAGIVHRQSEAEAWLSQYDRLVEGFNDQLDQELGERGTAIVWEICERRAYCFSGSFGRGSQILYDDLGFHFPSQLLAQRIDMNGYLEAEIESMADYPADYIFITSLPTFPEGQQRVNRLFQSQKWLQLDAVRKRRVYLLNQPELFFGFDPISTNAQLHELMDVLTRDHKFA